MITSNNGLYFIKSKEMSIKFNKYTLKFKIEEINNI